MPALAPKQIEQGIARLSDAVDDALDGHRIGLNDLLAHRSPSSRPASGSASGLLRRKPANRPHAFASNRLSPSPAPRSGSFAAMERSKGPGKSMTVVTGLYRYPIKGLSPQPVATVRVEAGKPFPVRPRVRPGAARHGGERGGAEMGQEGPVRHADAGRGPGQRAHPPG